MVFEKVIWTRSATTDDSEWCDPLDLGKTIDLKLRGEVHKSNLDVIVINYPGYGSRPNGYEDKYTKLADFLVEREVGSVVRLQNHHFSGFNYPTHLVENLRYVIDSILETPEDFCGSSDPDLYLMGFSAGASAIAAVAHEYDAVKKMLLMAPSSDAGMDKIFEGIGKFTGDLSICVGEKDNVVKTMPDLINDAAVNASSSQYVKVPDCDHQFKGKQNGMIMSKSPLWAFAGEKTFPSPEGGKVLYE